MYSQHCPKIQLKLISLRYWQLLKFELRTSTVSTELDRLASVIRILKNKVAERHVASTILTEQLNSSTVGNVRAWNETPEVGTCVTSYSHSDAIWRLPRFSRDVKC